MNLNITSFADVNQGMKWIDNHYVCSIQDDHVAYDKIEVNDLFSLTVKITTCEKIPAYSADECNIGKDLAITNNHACFAILEDLLENARGM